MEDIGLLLSYIETEVKEGKKAWIGNGVIVDRDTILNLVERIRIALPQATGEAQIRQAKKEAQEIIDLAEQRKATLIDNSMAMREAKARAEKIIVQAAENKKAVEKELEQNVSAVLSTVSNYLSEASKWVDNATKVVKDKLKTE